MKEVITLDSRKIDSPTGMSNILCKQCRSENFSTAPKCHNCGTRLLPKWNQANLLYSGAALLISTAIASMGVVELLRQKPLESVAVFIVSPVIVVLVGLFVSRRNEAGGFAERAVRGAKDGPDHALADMMHALQLDPKLTADARKVAQRVWQQRPEQAVKLLETALESCLDHKERASILALRRRIGREAQIPSPSNLPGLRKTYDLLQAKIAVSHGEEKHELLKKRAEVMMENGIAMKCASCNRDGMFGGMQYVVFGRRISQDKIQDARSRHGWICNKCGWAYIAKEVGKAVLSIAVSLGPLIYISISFRNQYEAAPKWFMAIGGVGALYAIFYVSSIFKGGPDGYKRFAGRRSVLIDLVTKQLPPGYVFWRDSIGIGFELAASDEIAPPTFGEKAMPGTDAL